MGDRNDGGPAFPRTVQSWNGNLTPHDGMSLRDWFAGQALSGIMSGYYANHYMGGRHKHDITAEAYELADAMIAAREARHD